MKYQKLLSVIPFYGGKGRMAHFIAERLDYQTSNVFVTPFGGGCRVLLNKPRHPFEIYNDYSIGLCTLMRVLSQRDTAIELIQRVMESGYSQEQFDEAKRIFDLCEKSEKEIVEETMIEEITNEFYRQFTKPGFLKRKSDEEKRRFKENLREDVKNALMESLYPDKENENQNNEEENPIYEKIKDEIACLFLRGYDYFDDSPDEETIRFHKYFDDIIPAWENAVTWGKDIYQIDDVELAFATYIVYTMSRDGMGKDFSATKFKGTEQYHKRAESLFACVERLDGLQVQQLDAFTFFKKQEDYKEGFFRKDYQLMSEWLDNPDVMMYLDPSYISVDSERKALEGIDWRNEDSLYEAIKTKLDAEGKGIKKKRKGEKKRKVDYKRWMPKNLGGVYSRSFNYEQQEQFLRLICQARCKILVSNYDLLLYDKYLTMNGWHRTEFHTFTGVGNRVGNERTEVIWWNY